MDANQTRFHLLLGEADWSRCTQLEPPPFRTQWDPTRYEVTLEEKLFRFLPSKFSPALRIEQRRGAGQDRFGNWYWISDSEQEILVHSTGSDQTTHFWSPGDEVRSERRNAGDFQPAESQPPRPPMTLRGLAVTNDHYLVVGLVKPAGLLIFDLYSGGPPQQFFWPATFAPFDMAARPGGGVWILDRENKRYWGLNRSFQILWLNKPSISSPPHNDLHHDFAAPEGGEQTAQKSVLEPPVSLDASVLLAASDPVAIESLPDGRVIILDAPSDTISGVPRFSTVWLYQLATLVSSATTESLSIMLEFNNQDGFALVGHDFVFIAQHTDSKGSHIPDRIYITATNGDQTFAFNLVLDPHAGLRLLAQDVYLPMRLFNGKALAAVGADLYYDFRDTWVKLVAQKRHLYAAEATLMTEPFDGDEPDCVWHRLMLDGCLPPETAIEVWSRTGNQRTDLDDAPWLQEPPLCRRSNGSELPWLPQPGRPNTGTWELLFQRAEGRFLQLQLRLSGNGRSTPRLRALRAYYPRFSYLKNYLPSLYREDRLSASFLDRFLANIEGTFTAIEDKIAAVQMLFDLQTAPADTLDWLAGWFGLVLDSTWDEARRRLLIRHAMDFFQWRGTIRGLVMGLRLAFEENPGPEMFTDAGAQSACARRFRVVEKFRTRRTPGLLLGAAAITNSSSSGLVSTQPGQRWTAAQGLGDLDRRYRAFLQTQDNSIHFTLARPDQTAAEQLWEAFAGQTLGFVPTVPPSDLASWRFFLSQRYGDITSVNLQHGANWASFDAVTLPTAASVRPEVWNDWRAFVDKPGLGGGERLGWWQDFLARRFSAVSTLNATYGTSWPEFPLIPLLAELPSNAAALSDWFQFEGIVLPFRAAAHRFSVLLPATKLEATDSQERLRTLQWASQIIELEKPAHTVFDVKFYWAFFRIGEARLGEDTQLGQGSRAPELLPPMIVDHAFLAEGYMAPAPPLDTRERRVLGRDAICR
jgi:phage tail-like protein